MPTIEFVLDFDRVVVVGVGEAILALLPDAESISLVDLVPVLFSLEAEAGVFNNFNFPISFCCLDYSKIEGYEEDSNYDCQDGLDSSFHFLHYVYLLSYF